jgi:hypothetical protein
MPAVRAIASALQKMTRRVAFATSAPPARADRPEQREEQKGGDRNADDEPRRRQDQVHGQRHRRPTAKVAAEVSAAWIGRAVVASDIPSSSRAWATSASFAISCSAT